MARTGAEMQALAGRSRGSVFLCTNEKAAESCRKNGLPYAVLDEDCIRPHYRRINQWAIEQSLFFIRKFRDDRPKHLFLETYFYDVKSIFIRCLKYILVLEKILGDAKNATLTAFGDGRSLLEITYAEYSKRLNPSFSFQLLPKKQKREEKKKPTPFIKKALLGAAASAVNTACRRRLESFAKKKTGFFFASGALHHLSPVLQELHRQGRAIVYGEGRFNLEKARYCVQNNLSFIVFPEESNMQNPFEEQPISEADHRILFDGRDLSSVYNAAFARLKDIGLLNIGLDAEALGEFFKKHKPQAILLDEDFALRRVLAFLAMELGIPCFVMSHGVPTVTMLQQNETPKNGFYESALTFVNSELEKEAFKSFFYDPEKLIVTGTPRYDALLSRRTRVPGAGSAKKILFIGQSTRPYDFEDHWAADLLGPRTLHVDYTRRYLKDLADILRHDGQLLLQVKPHYEDAKAWRALAAEAIQGGFCELLSSKDELFELLAQCELVVTMPSSVICEAIMLDKPVIVLNYGDDDLSERYEREGVAITVRGKTQLKAAIQNCLYDAETRERLSLKRRQHFGRFAGPFDGGATRRVVHRILHAP